jgi:hypothetical protein
MAADQGYHLQVREGRRPDTGTIRLCVSVTHKVISIAPFCSFDIEKSLTHRHDGSPADAEEMADKCFDIMHRMFFERRGCPWMVRFIRPVRHILHALFDYAEALTHLFDAHTVTVVAVSGNAGGNIEFESFIN